MPRVLPNFPMPSTNWGVSANHLFAPLAEGTDAAPISINSINTTGTFCSGINRSRTGRRLSRWTQRNHSRSCIKGLSQQRLSATTHNCPQDRFRSRTRTLVCSPGYQRQYARCSSYGKESPASSPPIQKPGLVRRREHQQRIQQPVAAR